MKNSDKLDPNFGLGIAVGLLSAALIFCLIAWLAWQLPLTLRLTDFSTHLRFWCATHINSWLPILFSSAAQGYRNFLSHPPLGLSLDIYLGRFNFAAFSGVVCGSYIGYLVGKPDSAERHIRGRQLKDGAQAKASVVNQSSSEAKRSGVGIKLHKQFRWHISLDRERQHTLIFGISGGGKTTLITPMMQAAKERGDQLVIYDAKGDFTEWMTDAVLLAPWDARGHALDIAKDCCNIQQARELAAHLIPEGKDPIWHLSARLILTALIIKLQCEKPHVWTWQDLFVLVCASKEDLLFALKKYTPEASRILETPDKTSQSILLHLTAHAWVIGDFAKAWGNAQLEKRFSVTEWIKGNNLNQKVLILQGSANFSILSNAYIQLFFSLATGLINSPQISKSKTRRLWFFLDEFPQLGKIDRFQSLLEVGRSKGVRVVAACQDISQIREAYGEHAANIWIGTVGTYILTKTGSGESANFMAEKLIGSRTIDRRIMNGKEISAPVREKELVVDPSELSDFLGPQHNGVNALLIGYKDALVLNWPYSTPKKLREGSELADWLIHKVKAPQQSSSNVTPDIEAKPRLKLRTPSTSELVMMAASGTNISNSGEEDFSSSFANGDDHESN